MDKDRIHSYVKNNIPIEFKIYAISTDDTIIKNIENIIITENIINADNACGIFNLTKSIKRSAIHFLKSCIDNTKIENNYIIYNTMTTGIKKKISIDVINSFINDILNKSQDNISYTLNDENFSVIKTTINTL